MLEQIQVGLSPESVLKDKSNPLDYFDNNEFFSRYPFSKESVVFLFELIKNDSSLMQRSHAVPSMKQLLITLRFYATGYFQMSVGDLMEVNQSTVCRIIHRISCCIARRKSNVITSLSGDLTTKQEFYNIAWFPSVVGAIDCTHIPIVSPGGDAAEVYRNRKVFFFQ